MMQNTLESDLDPMLNLIDYAQFTG